MTDNGNGAVKTPARPISLDDLKPDVVEVHITTGYNREIVIPFIPLTAQEWDDVGRAVPNPKVPKTKLAEDGQTLLPNPQDAAYLDKVSEADKDRMARRFFAALEKAGNTFPGETALDKLAQMQQTADNNLFIRLWNAVLSTGWGGSTELEKRAESFPPVELSPDTAIDSERERMDSDPVAEPTAG